MSRNIFVFLIALTMNAWGLPGDLDLRFNPNVMESGNSDGEVWAMALQGDGKIIVGGRFITAGGASRAGFARLNADGKADAGFPGPLFLDTAELSASCAVLSDGSVLSGRGVRVGGNASVNYAKFTRDGIVDQTFNAPLFYSRAILIQDDGKILAGGNFRNVAGSAGRWDYLLRLNADGSIDSTFTPRVVGINVEIKSMAWQPDGKFLIAGGEISTVGGVARRLLARLNADGTLDRSFNPNIAGANPFLSVVAVQPDGKIIISGTFATVDGQPQRDLARLNPDGSLDPEFSTIFTAGTFGNVSTCAVLADGRIVIGGSFEKAGSPTYNGAAVLKSDGSLDTTFRASVIGTTYGLTVQADGSILRGGPSYFASGATRRIGMARVAGFPATQSLEVTSPSNVKWLRGGGAPEVIRTQFSLSTDGGTNWTDLGEGSRITGGWEKTGLDLPLKGSLRARAPLPGGLGNGSPGWVETVITFALEPEIAVHDGATDAFPEITNGQVQAVDFGPTRKGTPVSRTFTISNTGNADLHIAAFATPAGYSLDGLPELPTSVAPSQSRSVQLILDGTVTGAAPGTVTISSDDADESVFSFPVTGLVVTPEISVHDGLTATDPAITDGQVEAVDFGRNAQGTAGTRNFTIANTGTAELLVSRLTVPPGYTVINVPLLPLTVGLEQSATFQVGLTTLTAGTHTGSVVIESDDLDEALFDFPVIGTVTAPEISVHDGATVAAPEVVDGQATAIDFGTTRQGTPSVRILTVANTGTAPLLLSGVTVPAGYTVQNLLPVTVGIDASFLLEIGLDATASGTFSGSITIASDDLDESVFDFPVTGTVVAPEIAIHDGATVGAPEVVDGQATAIDFGTTRQGTPSVRILTVANTGTAPLLLSGVTVPAGYTVQNLLPVTVGIDASFLLEIGLDATASGTFSGSITIASDDLDESVFDFPVTGTVVAPEIAIHDGAGVFAPEFNDGQAAAVDFGRNVQGTPGTRSFTIANTGTADLLVRSLTVPPGYTAINVPPLPLTVGLEQSATFQVGLTTLATGTHTGSVVIESDDLDEALFDFPLTGEVFVPDPVGRVLSTTTELNRQTGLREQTIHVINDTTATVPAYYLIIRGLPAGAEVNNASETRADGSVVIYIRQGLAPHSAQDIVVEYYSPNRALAVISPQLSTEWVPNPPDLMVAPGAQGLAVENITRLAGGEILLEFPTTPGRRYEIQFSRNGGPWQASLPQIRAAANRTQWLDRGLPRTDRHPGQDTNRFYRVREIP